MAKGLGGHYGQRSEYHPGRTNFSPSIEEPGEPPVVQAAPSVSPGNPFGEGGGYSVQPESTETPPGHPHGDANVVFATSWPWGAFTFQQGDIFDRIYNRLVPPSGEWV